MSRSVVVSTACSLALSLVGCVRVGVFSCQEEEDCKGAESRGSCVQGYCAFPSDACDSGLQFGEGAGSLSGSCVVPGSYSSSGADGEASSSDAVQTSTGADLPSTSFVDFTESSSGDMRDSLTSGVDGTVAFVDESQRDFEAGQSESVSVEIGRVALDLGASEGAFTSRVFDAGSEVEWQSLAWTPEGPYGIPMPANGAIETGYAEGGLDMTENVLLLRFDDLEVARVGAAVADASGAGNDGFVAGSSMSSTAGLIGRAADDTDQGYVSVPIASDGGFQFGTGDFTFALWFAYGGDCATNNVFMGADNADGSDAFAHLWLGCSGFDSACANDGQVRLAGTLTDLHDGAHDISYCSQTVIDDDQWHHAVMVKVGHNPTVVHLYVDGILEFEVGGGFDTPIAFPDQPDFGVGGFSRGTYPARGRFDEVAVWGRALSADEVAAIYRRGVTALTFQVRSCAEHDCSDDPAFVGGEALAIDGSFVAPSDALSPGASVSVDGVVGRYIQYRAAFAGPAVGEGPALARVELRGETP